MDVETSSSPDLPTEKAVVNVHLFNCDRTYKLESVEKLLRDVEANTKCEFSISKHYFPLPKMAETCVELAEYQMDFAVFVVHANESRLSLNEERAGIGYAKIYRALLGATGNRVLIVIGGDEYYEGEEDTQVLSRWAKLKILSQFSPEFLDGRESFIFSWEIKHRLIHEDAVLHFLDPEKQGQIFVPEVRSAPKPEQLETETIRNEDKLGSQTETDSSPPCTSEDDPSFKLKLGKKGTEEEQFVTNYVERNDYKQRHDEVNEQVTKLLQSSKSAEENNEVHTAVLGYKVQHRSFNYAISFVEAVGKEVNLTPVPFETILNSTEELTATLSSTQLPLSNLVVLVAEKTTVISKDDSLLLDLLKEMENDKGRHVVVIVCKDRDWEANQNVLVSQSVEEHTRQFEQHVRQFGEHVHPHNCVVYSWNEDDENFNTQSHEDDLVKKARNWFETQRLQAETGYTEVVNGATTESQNVSPHSDADFEKVEHSDCPTYRRGGGLLRMTVSLEHGEIKEAVQKFPDNWAPPPELLRGLKKLFHDTSFIDKVEIWEEEDGSHSIKKLDTATGIVWFVDGLWIMLKQVCF